MFCKCEWVEFKTLNKINVTGNQKVQSRCLAPGFSNKLAVHRCTAPHLVAPGQSIVVDQGQVDGSISKALTVPFPPLLITRTLEICEGFTRMFSAEELVILLSHHLY